jgi:hypothetical protein
MRLVATTAAERTALSAKSAPALVYTTGPGEFETLNEGREPFEYTDPPGTAPPTIRPAVLRI